MVLSLSASVFLLVSPIMAGFSSDSDLSILSLILVPFLFLWTLYSLRVKRHHDLSDDSIVGLMTGLGPSNPDENEYGPSYTGFFPDVIPGINAPLPSLPSSPPPETMAQGFTLKTHPNLINGVFWLLFSFEGRLSPRGYKLGSIVPGISLVALLGIFGAFYLPKGLISEELLRSLISKELLVTLLVLYHWPMLALNAKRLHDLGRSGWGDPMEWGCLSKPSVPEKNKYGEPYTGLFPPV